MTPFGSPVIGGQKPSLRFQKRLKLHAKIAQLILLPLLKSQTECKHAIVFALRLAFL